MTETPTTKVAPIELDPELTAALAEDGELTDDLAERIADQIKPREQEGERSYGRPSKWVVPIDKTIASYVTRSDVDKLALTDPTKAAWSVVMSDYDVVQEARADLDGIETERAVEARAADEAVAEQVRAGKSPKLPPGKDWSAEERTRAAVVRVRVEELAKARSSYDKVAAVEQPKRRQAALDRIKSTKAAADKLAPQTIAAVVAWRQAVDEGFALLGALEGPTGQLSQHRRHLTEDARRTLRDGQAAPGAMKALLDSDHPWLAGTYLADRGELEPPLWAREAISERGNEGEILDLAVVEIREDFKVTKYSYDDALVHGMIRPSVRRPMGR